MTDDGVRSGGVALAMPVTARTIALFGRLPGGLAVLLLAMLMAAAGQKYKMFLCVQDLTCPGASLIHSAGIASNVPGVSGIEANSRQYLPAANAAWAKTHPGLFVIKNGSMRTSGLIGPGLGAVPS